MFDRKVLKERAKAVLSRSFLTSVLACAIVYFVTNGVATYSVQKLQGADLSSMSDLRILAIYAVAGLIALIGIGLSIFVTSPLKVGLKYFMLRSADMDTKVENLLYPFKENYKNVVWVTFVRNLYVFLWSLLGLLPLVCIVMIRPDFVTRITELLRLVQNDSIPAAMELIFVLGIIALLTIIFTIPAIIKELQYSMVDYILAENPAVKRADAIGRSKEMMVGNKWAYVKLAFSFLGWALLANTVCCIGNFLLMPYIEATYAQMYLEISGQGKDYSDNTNYFNGF